MSSSTKQPFILDQIIWRIWNILEHSEESLSVNTIHSPSPSWTSSVLSHDQVIQWTKVEVLAYSEFRTVSGEEL